MLVFGHDAAVAEWVGTRVFGIPSVFDDKVRAIGLERNGSLIAGVVYSDFREDVNGNPLSIEMSIATVDKKWATRHNLRTFFAYPFIQLRLKRVQAVTSVNNEGAIKMLKRLGFSQEGLHKGAYLDGTDAVSFGMLNHECGWL